MYDASKTMDSVKHRARILGIVLLVVMFPFMSLASEEEHTLLKLGSDVWPPFTNVEGQSRKAIDLTEAALEQGQIRSHTLITPWDKVMAGLKNKTLDGSAAMWRSPERDTFMLFSNPYLENRLILVSRAGNPVNDLGIPELKGKRLALVRGYAYGNILDQAEGVTVTLGDSDAANLESVLSGKADYLLADQLLVHRLFEGYPEKARRLLAAGSTPIVTRALHFAIRKDYPGAAEIIKSFNQNIKQLIADGTYNRLLNIAWIRTDIGEDGIEDYISTASLGSQAPTAESGYKLFLAEMKDQKPDKKPSFVIDGKKYESWEEASCKVEKGQPCALGDSIPEHLAKPEEVELVLLDF